MNIWLYIIMIVLCVCLIWIAVMGSIYLIKRSLFNAYFDVVDLRWKILKEKIMELKNLKK